MIRLLTLVLALFLFVPPLVAQESYHEFERELSLSEAQRAQADSIKRKYIDEWNALREESLRRQLELRDLSGERPYQRARVQRLQRELYQIRVSRERLFRRYRGEVSTLFNEEQRGRFNRFMDRENRRPMNPPRYRMHER